jgi:hypothetical protein
MKRKKVRKAKPAPAKRVAKKVIKTKSRSSPRTVSKKTKATAQKPAAKKLTAKTAPPDALDALITASAHELKLPLEPAWRPGVKFNLNLILRIAALVDEFPLPDDAEPGPVFHA